MLSRFLARVPTFRLLDDEVVQPATIGIANGWMSVGVEFDAP